MARQWTVVTRFEGGGSLVEVVEAETCRIKGGALVFTDDELVTAYGPDAWTTVTPGGPGAVPDGAQVFERSR